MYDNKAIEAIKNALQAQKQTIAVAESVTSGHIQAAFSTATGAEEFFQGGITAYNAGQKCRHLNIEPIYSLKDNCISEGVACTMAANVARLFISDYGIGITGYASPLPEMDIGPGDLFAYFAIAKKEDILLCKKIITREADITSAQIDYTGQVLHHLKQLLERQ
jgi:PncC family amidohydrolase